MSTSRVPGPLGMDDTETETEESESGLLGEGRVPVPVGYHEEEAEPLEVSVLDSRPTGNGSELNLVATYPRPTEWTPAKEKELIGKETWFPHTLDFLAVAGQGSKAIGSPEDFMLKIVEATGPISRLNFISHGVTGKIATSGEVAADGTSCSLDNGWTQVFGGKRIADPYAKIWGDNGENSGSVKITVGKREFTLDDVRAKFTKEAEIWLYVCHGGADPQLLGNIANTFQVKVKSFSKIIVFCAPANFPTNRQHRVNMMSGSKPSDSCPSAVSDFRQVTSDRSATPNPP